MEPTQAGKLGVFDSTFKLTPTDKLGDPVSPDDSKRNPMEKSESAGEDLR